MTIGSPSFFHDADLDETKVEVKGSGGLINWLHIMNLSAAKLYLQVFNKKAVDVIVGTTVPDLEFVIQTLGDTNGVGFSLSTANGIPMSIGITIACTTNSEGNGAPSANDCSINMGY